MVFKQSQLKEWKEIIITVFKFLIFSFTRV